MTKRSTVLRKARLGQGLGLRETARLADISPSHLSQAERGVKRLSVTALHRLAPYIGLGPGDLLAAMREMGGEGR